MKSLPHVSSGDRVAVLGFGLSGVAAARLLCAHGIKVCIVDSESTPALTSRAAVFDNPDIEVVLGASRLPDIAFAMVVTSPGIPLEAPLMCDALGRGIRVVPELELGWFALTGKVLAITGSSGKSTLAKFCHDVFTAAGARVAIGANYGIPVSALALDAAGRDWYILEVSSFQLEQSREFRPDIGILLNLHPNHLDRHVTMDAYIAAKAKLFSHMVATDVALIPEEDRVRIASLVPQRQNWTTFGRTQSADIQYDDGMIRGKYFAPHVIDLRNSSFANDIMGVAAAAAAGAMHHAGIGIEPIIATAGSFQRLPHRMQSLPLIDGIRFINDSKATTLSALAAGVAMAGPHVRLIAGGRLKESDLNGIKKTLASNVEKVYLIGESETVLATAWASCVSCVPCGTLDRAVNSAWQDAQPGDTVLLSPGCASFDQFSGYEARGNRFIEIVTELQK